MPTVHSGYERSNSVRVGARAQLVLHRMLLGSPQDRSKHAHVTQAACLLQHALLLPVPR